MEAQLSHSNTQEINTPLNSFDNGIDLEFAVIVIAGMYLHLTELSIIDLKHSKLPGIKPNPASTLFVFSVLCILAKSRPYWPSCLRRPPRILRFCFEVFLLLYVMDRVLRQVWIPSLKFVDFLCNFLSEYLIVINTSLLATQMMAVAHWIRNRAFYYIRFMISLSMFYFMVEVTGMTEYFREVKTKLGLRSRCAEFAETTADLPSSPSDVSIRHDQALEQLPKKPRKRQIRIIPRKYRVCQYAPYPFD